jgi:hypothetical protein
MPTFSDAAKAERLPVHSFKANSPPAPGTFANAGRVNPSFELLEILSNKENSVAYDESRQSTEAA